MHRLKTILFVVFACTIQVLWPMGRGPEAAQLELSLKDAIAKAEQNIHSKFATSKLDERIAEEETKEIDSTFSDPHIEMISYSGVVPDAEGGILSEDTNGYDDSGPFFKVDFKVIQPLYSFGKYDSAQGAGLHNLEMKKALTRETRNDLQLEVIKAYFGVVAGQDSSLLSRDLRDNYSKLLKKIEKLLADPKADLDDADLLEAKALHFEIEKQCADIAAHSEQSLLYLKALLDLEADAKLSAVATGIPEIAEAQDFVGPMQGHLRDRSPLLHGLQSGMDAMTEKIQLERRKRYPDLFLALGAGYGTAPDRDELDNAYVRDEYNYERVVGVLGLKWDFNYGVSNAKIEKNLIEYQKLVKKRQLALQLQEGTIAKLSGEAVRKRKLFEAAEKSLKSATSWVRLESDNMDVGVGNIKRYVKAYQYYYQLKGEVISTKAQYLVTLAELAHAAGDTRLLLNWLEYGKVTL